MIDTHERVARSYTCSHDSGDAVYDLYIATNSDLSKGTVQAHIDPRPSEAYRFSKLPIDGTDESMLKAALIDAVGQDYEESSTASGWLVSGVDLRRDETYDYEKYISENPDDEADFKEYMDAALPYEIDWSSPHVAYILANTKTGAVIQSFACLVRAEEGNEAKYIVFSEIVEDAESEIDDGLEAMK